LSNRSYEVAARAGRWFVVDVGRGVELGPVFDKASTAVEIAAKAERGDPFFERIPEVPIGSPADRVGVVSSLPPPFER
jgi:hypothetical protein